MPNQFAASKTQLPPWLPNSPRTQYGAEITWHRLQTVRCRISFVTAVSTYVSLSNRANASVMKRCHKHFSIWCLPLASICVSGDHLKEQSSHVLPWFAWRSIVSVMSKTSYFVIITWRRFRYPSNSPRTVNATVSGTFELNDEPNNKIVLRIVAKTFFARFQCKTWKKWSSECSDHRSDKDILIILPVFRESCDILLF
jgi:hypothetical protein